MASLNLGFRSSRGAALAALAFAVGFLSAPDASAQAGARGLPMSRVVAKSNFKAAGCIIPAPAITISPSSITFPTPVAAGSCSSGGQVFTVTNTGTKSVFISYLGLSPPGDPDPFNLIDSCGDGTLAPGGSCSGTVQFCPFASAPPGAMSQLLTVYHEAGSNSIPLSGTVGAGAPTPVFQRAPASIDFGSIPLGGGSSTAYVTVSNLGTASFTVSSATTAAPFSVESNACGAVAPGGSCQIGVAYTASSTPTGPQSGSLTITHTAAGSPATTMLYGESVPNPGVTVVSPPSGWTAEPLSFYGVEQGGNATGTVYFTNLSGSPITVDNASLACVECGFEFVAGSDACSGATVPAGGSCSVGIQYTDSSSNPPFPYYATDTIQFISGPNNYSAGLSAEVVPAYPTLVVNPYFGDYGTVNLGSSSACQSFAISNYGTQPASFFLNGPYYGEFSAAGCTPPAPACTATSSTSQTLNAAEQCWVSYQYTPIYAGQTYDYLDVTDGNNWWGYVATVSLTGFGYQPGPRIDAFPTALSFGAHPLGTSAPNQSVAYTNVGDTNLTLSSFAAPGASGLSVVTDGCGPYPKVLAAGSSCTVTFGFTAVLPYPISDSATMFSDAVNVPSPPGNGIAVFLDGEGTAAPTPSADFYPMQLDFLNVVAPGPSPVQSVSFANTGSGPMSISSVGGSGDFAVSHDCPLAPATLAPGTCCTLQASFAPTFAGLQSSAITVDWTDPAIPTPPPQQAVIPVQGNGVAPPSVTASPTSVGFADQIINTASAPQQVVFTNSGITDITITALTALPATDFGVSPLGPPISPPGVMVPKAFRGLPAKVTAKVVRGNAKVAYPSCSLGYFAKGDSCVATVAFKPTALGSRTAVLALSFTDGTSSPALVALSGNGVPADYPGIGVSADSVSFGDVVIGSTSTRTITVSSVGTAPLSVVGVRAIQSIFSATTDCGSAIPPGGSCQVRVSCTPSALVRVEGDLYIDHNASGGFRRVGLICTGAPLPVPKIDVSLTSIRFANQTLSTESAAQRITIKSVGNAPLAIGGIGTAVPFAMRSDCPAVLPEGATCSVDVTFTPSASGFQAGVLSIPSNDPARPMASVDLGGTGCRPFSMQAARRGQNLCAP